jgi:hypothetical protein
VEAFFYPVFKFRTFAAPQGMGHLFFFFHLKSKDGVTPISR